MRKPSYPLQTVRAHRRREQETALRRLAHRVREESLREASVRAAEQAAVHTRRALEQAQEGLVGAGDAGGDGAIEAGLVQLRCRALSRLEHRLEKELETVEDENRGLDEARQATGVAQSSLADKTRELEVVERHHVNWRSRWLLRLRRSEDRLLGELATHSWLRQGENR